jgi:hypothetical protein
MSLPAIFGSLSSTAPIDSEWLMFMNFDNFCTSWNRFE